LLPVEEEFAAKIRNHERRLKRLETLEDAGGGDWILIENITLGDDGDPVQFASIPQVHKHLFVLYSAGVVSGGVQHIRMNFNNDVGAQYNYLGSIFGTSGGQTADTAEGVAFMHVGRAANQQAFRPSNFAAGHIFIADYRGTGNFKTVVFSNHYDSLGSLEVPDSLASIFGGGTWEDDPPGAITEIDFTLDNAADFRQDTVFSLYGVN